ncbi:hypothetical protein DMENIID0001_033500 [Sergentomyia squamirostris]
MFKKVFLILCFSFFVWDSSGQDVSSVNVRYLDLIHTVDAPAGAEPRLVRTLLEEVKRIERVSQRLIRNVKEYQEEFSLPQAALTESAIRQWYRLARRALLIETSIMRLYRDQAEYRLFTFNKRPFVSFIRVLLQSSRKLLDEILLIMDNQV